MVPTGPIVRRRIALSMAIFLILFTVLGARLFVIQVVMAESLTQKAEKQWTMESVIQPKRGSIFDRNLNVLAESATAFTLSASPRQVKNPSELSKILAPLLEMDEKAILKRISDKTKGGVTVKRQLDYNIAQQLKMMITLAGKEGEDTFDGLYLEQDSKRYYPYGQFACQLLGLTTIDGVGQSGLESAYNNYLSGKTGSVVYEIDGKGRQLSSDSGKYVSAVNGSDVILTIDAVIQGFCEKAAREAMEVNNAEGVRILCMNPQTGEILAMVSKPDYDPNDPPRDDVSVLTSLMRNRVLSDAYEPGSTFKMITMAACLEEGLARLSDTFYCSGSIYVEGGRVRCWGNPHGSETLTEALENSCNPVFVELGLRLGIGTFYDYLDAFGFGKKRGIDIPGESAGILIGRNTVKKVDIARIGFGQSVAVTPIQLLTAACAVVNGGNLFEPYVVKEIRDAAGNTIEKSNPNLIAKPISSDTSKIMKKMLESVVEEGGGKNAYIAGYHVGGKTGTAQVYENGAISTGLHIGSFVGFAPMDDPEIAVLVIVDKADTLPDYGSVTAAPFARDILSQSLAYLGVEIDKTEVKEEKTAEVPDVRGMTLQKAAKTIEEAGFGYMLSGTGTTIEAQMPAGGTQMAEGSNLVLYMDGNLVFDPDAYISVPDITGFSVMEANRVLVSYGLALEPEGSGIAVSQEPEPGEYVFPTSRIKVKFEMPQSG